MTRRFIVAAAASLTAALAVAGAVSAATVTPVMTALDNPRGLSFGPEGALYVAEGGRGGAGPPCAVQRGQVQCYGATGAISRLWRGVQERWVTGLPSIAPADGSLAEGGPQDIDFQGRGGAYVTLGLGRGPVARAALEPQMALSGWLIKLSASGQLKTIADLAEYEGASNPDGRQIDSNPFRVLALPGGQVVVDAGANAVVGVGADSVLSTLATFGPRSNPLPIGPPFVDPVPTAAALGPDGSLYVSELTGVPFVTGFSRVHRIAPDGTTAVFAGGLTAVVDLAFGDDGSLYALQHASCGPFFACPGSIVRVGASPPHEVVHGGLTQPAGLTIGPDGAFYVSNRSGSAAIGEVLRIEP